MAQQCWAARTVEEGASMDGALHTESEYGRSGVDTHLVLRAKLKFLETAIEKQFEQVGQLGKVACDK